MNIRVFVKKVLPEIGGISAAGNQWTKNVFVCETTTEYPKTIAFTIFNKKTPVPTEGSDVVVDFDLESRSFIGKDGIERWSTDANAWRVTPYAQSEMASEDNNRYQQMQPAAKPQATATAQQAFRPSFPQPQAPQAAPQHQAAPQATDDLPF